MISGGWSCQKGKAVGFVRSMRGRSCLPPCCSGSRLASASASASYSGSRLSKSPRFRAVFLCLRLHFFFVGVGSGGKYKPNDLAVSLFFSQAAAFSSTLRFASRAISMAIWAPMSFEVVVSISTARGKAKSSGPSSSSSSSSSSCW